MNSCFVSQNQENQDDKNLGFFLHTPRMRKIPTESDAGGVVSRKVTSPPPTRCANDELLHFNLLYVTFRTFSFFFLIK